MPRGRKPANKAVEEQEVVEAAVETAEAVEEPKRRGRKPGSKNKTKAEEAAVEAAPVEEAEEKPVKTRAKAVESNVVLQFDFGEFATADIVEQCKKSYEAENTAKVKKIDVYVKPADKKVYYVVNDKVAGDIDLL